MFVKLLGLLATGFFLGMQHSLDPDHVAAVSTIVSKNRSLKKSALVGAVWGLGHTSILLLVGLVVMMLKLSIPEKSCLRCWSFWWASCCYIWVRCC